jgi:hypothetical protein
MDVRTGEERVRREQAQVGPERRARDGERGLEAVPWVGLLEGVGVGFGGGDEHDKTGLSRFGCVLTYIRTLAWANSGSRRRARTRWALALLCLRGCSEDWVR